MTFQEYLGLGQAKRAAVFPWRSCIAILLFSGMSLRSFASGELREGREFKKNGCYARLTDNKLVIGNKHVRRTWHVEQGQLFATSFLDLDERREWINAPSRQPSPEPPVATKGESLVMRGGNGDFGPTEAESMRVELEESGANAVIDYEFQVFPEASGIRM